ncbi:MAG: alpha/beta hydrolase [Isosphaeraceae bacterium]
MPSLQARLLRPLLDLRRALFRWDAPVDRYRALMRHQEKYFKPPRDVQIEPALAGHVPAEWLTPPGASDCPVILYLHGGAWTFGWTNIHRRMVAHLAKAARCRVLAVDYRLAPEHPFPAALEDCLAAYRWLRANGISPGEIAIAGDSAGGNLTLTTQLCLRDAGEPLPAAAVCLSPATDLEGTGASFWTSKDPVITPEFVVRMRKLYIGDHDARSPLISPHHGDIRGLPPLLIQAGGDEMLLSDSERLAEKAGASGVDVTLAVWPKMWHVWHLFVPTLPESREAVESAARFIAGRLRTPLAPERTTI